MNKHDYGLTWIDNDALYYEVKRNFDKFFAPERNKKQLPPDPFLILTQALITGESLNDSLGFEKTRKINKSLSNALGDRNTSATTSSTAIDSTPSEARGLRRMSVTVSSPADERKGRDWFRVGLSRCQGHDAKALSILRIILRKEVISNTIGFRKDSL